jgi:hypothetical protein
VARGGTQALYEAHAEVVLSIVRHARLDERAHHERERQLLRGGLVLEQVARAEPTALLRDEALRARRRERRSHDLARRG